MIRCGGFPFSTQCARKDETNGSGLCPFPLQVSQNDSILQLVRENPKTPSGEAAIFYLGCEFMLKRNVQVICRLSEEEYFQLKRTARAAGFSVAAFIRRRCLTDERIVILEGEAVRELYREINHIGNNINQLTRYANTDKRITAEMLERVEAWMMEIKELIDEKLGGL